MKKWLCILCAGLLLLTVPAVLAEEEEIDKKAMKSGREVWTLHGGD